MLVDKDKFIYYVNKYKAAYEEQRKFHDAIRPYFDFPVCTYMTGLMEAYEELLTEISECSESEDGIFWWWLTDSPNAPKIITVEHQPGGDRDEYDVETVEGLYEYLYDMYNRE
jgi:hypothetical protein